MEFWTLGYAITSAIVILTAHRTLEGGLWALLKGTMNPQPPYNSWRWLPFRLALNVALTWVIWPITLYGMVQLLVHGKKVPMDVEGAFAVGEEIAREDER